MKNKIIYYLIPGVIIILGIVISISSYGSENTKQAAPKSMVLPFPVVKVVQQNTTSFQKFPASIEGEINSEVRPKVTGYIQDVLVDEGDIVKQGQLLFKLETQSLSQDAAAAKANVNTAQLAVNKLIPLVEKNIISNIQLETAKAQLEQAKSAYNSVIATINYANVKSPVNGVVGSINYRKGALVSASNSLPLTSVSSIENVYAYFSMNEKAFIEFIQNAEGKTIEEKIKALPKVQLELANGKVYEQDGIIETITGDINQQTGSVTFRAKFNNEAGLLRNGSSGTISVPKIYKNALVIPAESTFENQGKKFVYTVQGDSLVNTSISVLDSSDKLYIIESGLQEGTIILAKGVGKVKPGMKIAPILTPLDSITNSFQTVFK
ncbi:efflux RND transporter periplasmic adaptor subunit [Lutibacter maritimus]|uniref:Membrane fusion protein, multidrug efflux system n=1 Tax=Lutibacter maritimus TaxID=593133 RepID=A0A1I6P3U0_9FLAO|nr:efflux RND transporter periplasmic adaptor subunit [Lutibacter maritimus]SFS34874.1 membrane fusion protein, multidrug efflux system [Lutibacter maritimus]